MNTRVFPNESLGSRRAAQGGIRGAPGAGYDLEASDPLAPVPGWFTAGFDTADLKEAKALL